MLEKIVIFIIRTVICFVIILFVAALGGCGTFGATEKSLYGPYSSIYRPNNNFYQNLKYTLTARRREFGLSPQLSRLDRGARNF